VFGEQNHLYSLLNHFTANSVQLPVVVIPRDTTALGSIVIQALTSGHIKCLEEARQILHKSVPSKTILPHGTAWDNAYQRMLTLKAA
jgi:rhamnulokinase